ncbi:MAG: Fic family protein [Gemmatimonadota bacterium]|nr:Fic family protein [Gemmatimonadota bacterium]
MPDPLIGTEFSMSSGVAATVSEAETAIQSLNQHAEPALAPLARLLLRTESIASSKIEGLQVGIRQLARSETKLETGGKASVTVQEVLGNIDAMQLAVDDASHADRITVKHLVEIHDRLMTKAPNAHVAGRIRADQNWIGGNDYNPCGADFVPPPPEMVDEGLTDLCEAIAGDEFSPLVQAALIHAQFETIHPFEDGNGRTGRALIHVVLRRRGIAKSYVPPISVVLANDRDRYIHGLTDFRHDRVEAWIEHFAVAAAQSAALAATYLEAVTRLMDSWRDKVAGGAAPRADAAAWAVIDALPAHPVITLPTATAATGRAKSSVNQAIEQLAACGVLEPLSTSKRNRSWEAVGLLDLLEELEAGRMPGR